MDKEKESKNVFSVDLEDSDTNDSNCNNSALLSESDTTNNKKVKKITKALKEVMMNDKQFLSDFDPELSNRERRKLSRKFHGAGRKSNSIYDENGILFGSEKDICDCLIEDCPGCHFPCPKCRSYKCGYDCRANRKWMYEAIENEDETLIAKNTRVSDNCYPNS